MFLKCTILAGVAAATVLAQEETPDHRMRAASEVIQQLMSSPDAPQDLMNKAKCVVVIPGVKKGAFLVGGEYGRGYAICRSGGGWGGPAAVKIGGGSFGAQLGVESTDVILLVMNDRGMQRLEKDKVTLGADASIAAGPLGRRAAADTDASMRAEILSYSRSHGVFAGIALDGAVLSRDDSEDRRLYGRDVTNGEVLRGQVAAPDAASVLRSSLGSRR